MFLKQEAMVEQLQARFQNSSVHEKFTTVLARKAGIGELVETVTSDGKETENTAGSGDMVVRNSTNAEEEYIIKPERFEARYFKVEDGEDGWDLYQAKGKCRAIEVDDELLDYLKQDQRFTFEAPWGESMFCVKGDKLVSPSTELPITEVYRIAAQEFGETYRPVS